MGFNNFVERNVAPRNFAMWRASR